MFQPPVEFLYDSRIWDGANKSEDRISNIDLESIPLDKNKTDGIIESDNALEILSFFQRIIHNAQ